MCVANLFRPKPAAAPVSGPRLSPQQATQRVVEKAKEKPTPVERPVSETVRRAGEIEAAQRRRQSGIKRHIVTSPLGIPVDDRLGAVA